MSPLLPANTKKAIEIMRFDFFLRLRIRKKANKDLGLAIFFSIIINIILFGLMPELTQSLPQKSDSHILSHAIQMVRIKKKPPDPKEKEKPAPEKKPDPLPKDLKPRKLSLKNIRLDINLNSNFDGISRYALPLLDMNKVQSMDLPDSYGVDEIDEPLTSIVRIPPIYPVRAKRMAVTGWVKVKFLVSKEGHVENVSILEASPPGYFEKSVMDCVSRWQFKPGTVEGVKVSTWAKTTIEFKLEE